MRFKQTACLIKLSQKTQLLRDISLNSSPASFFGVIIFFFFQAVQFYSHAWLSYTFSSMTVAHYYSIITTRSISLQFLIVAAVSRLLVNGYLQRLRVPLWVLQCTEQITTSNLTPLFCIPTVSIPLITNLVKDLMVFDKVPILILHTLKHGLV